MSKTGWGNDLMRVEVFQLAEDRGFDLGQASFD